MILCATQKVAPRANLLQVFSDFANYVAILTEAISQSTFFYSVECPSVVKLLFRYPDMNFSNEPHVTSAPGCFPAN